MEQIENKCYIYACLFRNSRQLKGKEVRLYYVESTYENRSGFATQTKGKI